MPPRIPLSVLSLHCPRPFSEGVYYLPNSWPAIVIGPFHFTRYFPFRLTTASAQHLLCAPQVESAAATGSPLPDSVRYASLRRQWELWVQPPQPHRMIGLSLIPAVPVDLSATTGVEYLVLRTLTPSHIFIECFVNYVSILSSCIHLSLLLTAPWLCKIRLSRVSGISVFLAPLAEESVSLEPAKPAEASPVCLLLERP
ncbi:hypothetical protein VUR80DRAFT_6388 [Thermomyces stellatus]